MHSSNLEIGKSLTTLNSAHFESILIMNHSEMYEDLNMLSEAQKPLLKVLLGNRGSKNKICPFEMYDFKL